MNYASSRRRPIRELIIISFCLLFLGLYLFLERLSLSRYRKRIPVLIAVTGTRGKSTVTRFIVASLRQAGISVLGKTTGSKPVIMLPDGREEEIRRRGLPTILEEIKLLKRGAELGVEALVTELMSIRPESSLVESRRILGPQILVITNVRLDHREEMGRTKPEIAQSLASAIPAGAAVFLPDEEFYPEFEEAAAKMKSKIVRVKKKGAGEDDPPREIAPHLSFEENIRLALAVSGHLGVRREAALSGILKAGPDFGSLKIWEAELGAPPAHWLLVSVFAANEPESTALVLDRLREGLPLSGRTLVGILSFREDRGDRTLQWLRAVEQGYFRDFSRIFAVGGHVHTLRVRKGSSLFPPLIPLAAKSPAAIMQEIVAGIRGRGVLIGMGNMGGLGEALVGNWEKTGRPYAP